jgi:hypothetical protein
MVVLVVVEHLAELVEMGLLIKDLMEGTADQLLTLLLVVVVEVLDKSGKMAQLLEATEEMDLPQVLLAQVSHGPVVVVVEQTILRQQDLGVLAVEEMVQI